MSTFYVVAWHENNNIIAVEAPTALLPLKPAAVLAWTHGAAWPRASAVA